MFNEHTGDQWSVTIYLSASHSPLFVIGEESSNGKQFDLKLA